MRVIPKGTSVFCLPNICKVLMWQNRTLLWYRNMLKLNFKLIQGGWRSQPTKTIQRIRAPIRNLPVKDTQRHPSNSCPFEGCHANELLQLVKAYDCKQQLKLGLKPRLYTLFHDCHHMKYIVDGKLRFVTLTLTTDPSVTRMTGPGNSSFIVITLRYSLPSSGIIFASSKFGSFAVPFWCLGPRIWYPPSLKSNFRWRCRLSEF